MPDVLGGELPFYDLPTTRKQWGYLLLVILIAIVGFISFVGLKHRSEYNMVAARTEHELVHTAGRITRVSDHIPHVEIRFDDGRVALATFVTFPIYEGKSLYVRDTGPFDSSMLPRLITCTKTTLELLPNPGSLMSYWIYAVTCDGVVLLSYSDTMNYLHAQKRRVGQ
ncbi:hypothetical protein ACFPTO_20475 [Paraburkholderia denitrificans]|uniref:DUF3592 domain-containing protein n=1 Tax=Paraburkholderia denitrificans TaxID=694025 RepID=A0ABW0JDC0_9BURK